MCRYAPAPTSWAAILCPICWYSAGGPAWATGGLRTGTEQPASGSAEAIDATAQQALKAFERTEKTARRRRIRTRAMDLQYVMNGLVGIIATPTAENIRGALFWPSCGRANDSSKVTINQTQILSIDLRNMLLVSEVRNDCATAHQPAATPETTIPVWTNWRRILLVCRATRNHGRGGSGSGDQLPHQRRSGWKRPADPTCWALRDLGLENTTPT